MEFAKDLQNAMKQTETTTLSLYWLMDQVLARADSYRRFQLYYVNKSKIVQERERKSSDATTNQPQTLSKKMVKDEYDKTEKAYKELKEKIPELKDWLLFICINGPKTDDALDLLQSNCLVVYKANFKDFYGYTYSSHAEFSEANDKLDANTASEYELRTVEMMKEETAREICNKRLYDDEGDLYSKVSMNEQAKKRIKVVKKIN